MSDIYLTLEEVPICSVEGCDRPAICKNMCHSHYQRMHNGLPVDVKIQPRGRCKNKGCNERPWFGRYCKDHFDLIDGYTKEKYLRREPLCNLYNVYEYIDFTNQKYVMTIRGSDRVIEYFRIKSKQDLSRLMRKNHRFDGKYVIRMIPSRTENPELIPWKEQVTELKKSTYKVKKLDPQGFYFDAKGNVCSVDEKPSVIEELNLEYDYKVPEYDRGQIHHFVIASGKKQDTEYKVEYCLNCNQNEVFEDCLCINCFRQFEIEKEEINLELEL